MTKAKDYIKPVLTINSGPAPDKAFLVIEGLRQNNLRNLTLAIPHDRITAIVGLSGSGKSSLAFDTLFAEGRWRFIESLSTYTRLFLERMDRPDLDAIRNIRPAIAVEQKNPVRTSRSTVGTATEVNDYLRLVFARAGRIHCPECGAQATSHTPQSAASALIKEANGSRAIIGFTLGHTKAKAVHAAEELSKKGFYRVRSKGQTYNLAEDDLPYGMEDGLEVITDRLVIKEEAASRLAEAVETAFREGSGRAWAEAGEGENSRRMSFHEALQCPVCGLDAVKPTPFSLSFNHPIGACPECKGFGNLLTYDTDKIIQDPSKSLRAGAIEPWTKPAYRWWHQELIKHAKKYNIDLDTPFAELTGRERELVFKGTDTFDGVDGFFAYLETKKYKLHIKVFTARYKGQAVCPSCNGTRLRRSALNVRLGGKDIAEVSAMPVKDCLTFVKTLELTKGEAEIADEPLRQLGRKLEFLKETGLGYVTLDRQTKTLSGGEFQRISLATQLGSMLTGVLYILDEPSIGLHPVDVDMLTAQIKKLVAAGNTVVIVEHDPAIIRAADHIIELGPGAGERGGKLVYSGPAKTFLTEARTLTADYMTGRNAIRTPRWRRGGSGQSVSLTGATGFNLKDVDVEIPLRTLTCVSGVSGSGKSTLIVETLYNAMAERFKVKAAGSTKPQPYRSLNGLGHISGVKLVDQSPIGRTPRSNPLTYIGGFDEVRKLYASLPSARATGLTTRHFSFNVPGGRCEACKGEGVTTLEMYFLPDVYMKCAECNGRRYKRDILGVRYKGRSIHDCLAMTFEEAAAVFPSASGLQRRLDIIKDVGLGYLRLGQSGLTLSGGEAQRLKIARELSEGLEAEALYILDEPTTGLHPEDTRKLLSVLGRLVDNGSTVVVIEHNMDFLKCADHIIDLGPGGGEAGGRIVAFGAPEDVAADKRSVTGRYLKTFLG